MQLPTTLEEAEKRMEQAIVKRAMFKRKIAETDKKLKEAKKQQKDLEKSLKTLAQERDKLIRSEGKTGQERLTMERLVKQFKEMGEGAEYIKPTIMEAKPRTIFGGAGGL